MLIVEGRAEKPVYIVTQDGQVEIKDAQHLMGMLTHETPAAIRTELNDEKLKIAAIGPSGEKLVRFAVEGKGAMCKQNQDKVAIYETGVACIIPMALNLIDLTRLREMLYAATGIEAVDDEKYLWQAGERMWNIERCFNVREGFGRSDDYLPERFLTEPLERGPVKGQVVEMDRLLDDYYYMRGWDKATGYPKREKLESLGLKAVADELAKLGRLG